MSLSAPERDSRNALTLAACGKKYPMSAPVVVPARCAQDVPGIVSLQPGPLGLAAPFTVNALLP